MCSDLPMSYIHALLLTLLLPLQALSQLPDRILISGRVIDKDLGMPMVATSISLTSGIDSMTTIHTTTDTQGTFSIILNKAGLYQLYVSCLGYQTLHKAVKIDDLNQTLDLGKILLQRKEIHLSTVEIVKKKPGVIMKKDTMEFNAGYFKTSETALLEALLKKIPGIRISADGKITVNGEPVQKLLIDGVPFFSGDPQLTLQNLSADLIDKIQIIDSRSGNPLQSALTTDNARKVINLTIKKKYKGGVNGRSTLGIGTQDRFAMNINLNHFGDNQQLAIIGNGNNTNGNADNNTLPNNIENSGSTRSYEAGINYNRQPNKNLRLRGNYIINNTLTTQQRNSNRETILPYSASYYDQQLNNITRSNAHTLFLRADQNIDSLNTLIVATNINYKTIEARSANDYATQDSKMQTINNGSLYNLTTGSAAVSSTALSYNKRSAKSERSIGAEVSLDLNKENEQLINRSETFFLLPDGNIKEDTIDQQQIVTRKYRQLSTYLFYNEPLFSGYILELYHNINYNNTSSQKETYNYNTQKGVYDQRNDSLSNLFQNDLLTQTFSVNIRKQGAKFALIAGGYFQKNILRTNNKSSHNRTIRTTANLLPRINFKYYFSGNKYLKGDYIAMMSLPVAEQLQPVLNNSNPLYLQLGDPDLLPVYSHNLSFEYTASKPNTFDLLSLVTRIIFIKNKIIIADSFDTLGRHITQPMNQNGTYNISNSITKTFSIDKLNARINSAIKMEYGKDVYYLNAIKGNNYNLNLSNFTGLNYTIGNWLDITLENELSYTSTRYSLQPGESVRYLSNTSSLYGTITLPKAFIFGWSINNRFNTGLAADYKINRLLLELSISKSVFKYNQGLIKLKGTDLLDQNKGFERLTDPNFVEVTRSGILKRYFLLSFSYFLKKRSPNAVQ